MLKSFLLKMRYFFYDGDFTVIAAFSLLPTEEALRVLG